MIRTHLISKRLMSSVKRDHDEDSPESHGQTRVQVGCNHSRSTNSGTKQPDASKLVARTAVDWIIVPNGPRDEEAHRRLVDGIDHRRPEQGACVLESLDSALVSGRVRHDCGRIDVLVECAENNDGKGGEGEIEQQDVAVVIQVC